MEVVAVVSNAGAGAGAETGRERAKLKKDVGMHRCRRDVGCETGICIDTDEDGCGDKAQGAGSQGRNRKPVAPGHEHGTRHRGRRVQARTPLFLFTPR